MRLLPMNNLNSCIIALPCFHYITALFFTNFHVYFILTLMVYIYLFLSSIDSPFFPLFFSPLICISSFMLLVLTRDFQFAVSWLLIPSAIPAYFLFLGDVDNPHLCLQSVYYLPLFSLSLIGLSYMLDRAGLDIQQGPYFWGKTFECGKSLDEYV